MYLLNKSIIVWFTYVAWNSQRSLYIHVNSTVETAHTRVSDDIDQWLKYVLVYPFTALYSHARVQSANIPGTLEPLYIAPLWYLTLHMPRFTLSPHKSWSHTSLWWQSDGAVQLIGLGQGLLHSVFSYFMHVGCITFTYIITYTQHHLMIESV